LFLIGHRRKDRYKNNENVAFVSENMFYNMKKTFQRMNFFFLLLSERGIYYREITKKDVSGRIHPFYILS